MAVNIIKLKKQAIAKGMPKADATKASRATLEAFIANGGGKQKSPVKKAAVKKASAVKKAAGRKAKATSPVAKATKRTGTAKRNNGKVDAETGRAAITKLDYSVESDDWNPRAGSAVERIWKCLKKNRDNVDKVFNELKADLYDFVGKTGRSGNKRSKAEAEAVLRYRINRTRFEYAVRTGQHSIATNRVKYGTGASAKANKKPARASKKRKSAKK